MSASIDAATSSGSSRDVAMLAACHGFGISSAVVSVTISALAAAGVGATAGWTTVPYGLQFLAVLLTTLPASVLMQRLGRRPVFLFSASCGVLSGIVGYAAISQGSFPLLCAAHALLGINLASVNFYRFAAVDVAVSGHRASAMSLVLFGGTFAALLGPVVTREAGTLLPGSVFQAAYLGISGLSAAIAVMIAAVRFSPGTGRRTSGLLGPGVAAAFAGARVRVGVAAGALGYGFMNLLMIGCSIEMSHHDMGFTPISYAIQLHVLAMYLPSLFMGRLIERFGALAIVSSGTALLAAAAVSALASAHAPGFFVSLVLLGLGWNALYVGSSAIVAGRAPEHLKFQIQGLNDLVVGVFAMLGAFLPGALLATIGWFGMNVLVIAASAGLAAAIVLAASRERLEAMARKAWR